MKGPFEQCAIIQRYFHRKEIKPAKYDVVCLCDHFLEEIEAKMQCICYNERRRMEPE